MHLISTLYAGLSGRHGRGGEDKGGSLHSAHQQRAHSATRERDGHMGKTETKPGQTGGLGNKWNEENLRKFPHATNSTYIIPRIKKCVQ